MNHRECFAVCGLLAWSLVACWPQQPAGQSPDASEELPVQSGEGAAGASSDSPSPSIPIEPPLPPLAPSDANVLEEALDVGDRQLVEVIEIVRQATALARRLEADAYLVDIGARDLRNGLLDPKSPADPLASVRFNFSRRDPIRPLGSDMVEGRIDVSLARGKLRAHRDGSIDTLAKTLGPLPLPACAVEMAWAEAVDSGVPHQAIAGVALWRIPLVPAVWMFQVAGYPDYQREVDVTTCAVRGRRAPTKQAPKAGPKPKPANRRDCGCEADDLLCRMKCFPG